MRIIHTLSALCLTALYFIPSTDKRVLGAVRINAPVLYTAMGVTLLRRGQVWDAVVGMSDPGVLGRLRARDLERIVHVRREGLVAAARFAESVQADVVVCRGQLGGSECCHRRAQTIIKLVYIIQQIVRGQARIPMACHGKRIVRILASLLFDKRLDLVLD